MFEQDLHTGKAGLYEKKKVIWDLWTITSDFCHSQKGRIDFRIRKQSCSKRWPYTIRRNPPTRTLYSETVAPAAVRIQQFSGRICRSRKVSQLVPSLEIDQTIKTLMEICAVLSKLVKFLSVYGQLKSTWNYFTLHLICTLIVIPEISHAHVFFQNVKYCGRWQMMYKIITFQDHLLSLCATL